MINADRATMRRLIDGLSKKTAISMMEIMIQERTAETAPPEMRI